MIIRSDYAVNDVGTVILRFVALIFNEKGLDRLHFEVG